MPHVNYELAKTYRDEKFAFRCQNLILGNGLLLIEAESYSINSQFPASFDSSGIAAPPGLHD